MNEEELARFTYEFILEYMKFDTPSWTLFEEEERRKKICEECDYFKPIRRQCKDCGCPIDSKVSEPMEECPQGKWAQHYESFRVTSYDRIREKLRENGITKG